ncbi:MAG TPA: endonuclease/exonuclease/phosphatase family protein, partial [Ilumatobacteraceae bacterium]|nr:endonuclease/exonuclease/phosphatase family protein [Ilumatobacteraceae bacterium]
MTTWRVMTWNIRGSKNPDVAALAEVIRDAQADVVCLQEILEHQAKRLVKELGGDIHWGRKHSPYGPFFRSRTEGLAVWS